MRFYFDHNACTPVDPRVLERFLEVEREYPANPGSLHASGRAARALVEESRARGAAALGATVDEVCFVSGGTEANNMVVQCAGDLALPVLLAPLEHPSVLEPATQRGTSWWRVDREARAIVETPLGKVGLVCLVHAQNEVGTLQPLREARRTADQLGAPLHVDASQSLGRIPLDDAMATADTLTFAVHKAGGLKGCSILLVRATARQRGLGPLLHGGGQEAGLRPGTPSPALAAATALAIELAQREQVARASAMAAARDAFLEVLGDLPGATVLTPASSLPNTAMVTFADVEGRLLLPALDMAGVEASQGSACSSGSPTPPRVLAAMGLDTASATRCVRFSFAPRVSDAEARAGAEIVTAVVRRLRR